MLRTILTGFLTLTVISLIATNARAEGEQRHDGFMLRFSPGHGAVRLSDHRAGTSSATSESIALGHASAFDLGMAIARGLSIHVRWSVLLAMSEDVVAANMYAAGLTYYLQAPNVYVTLACGIAYDGLRNAGGVKHPDDNPVDRPIRQPGDDSRVAASSGIGLELDLGKEFWVSDNWGIGPALRVALRQLDHAGPGGPWLTAVLAVFSATYQ